MFLLFYLIFSFLTFKSYGITNDEHEEYLLGKFLYTKLVANDQILETDFVVNKTTNRNLLIYDRIYPAILYAINGSESYKIYHLLNLLFASVIFISIFEVLYQNTSSAKLAILGPIFLFFTPRFLGQLANNPKDMPFAIFYFLSLTLIYLFSKNKFNNNLKMLILGLVLGLTGSMRLIGYSIYLIYLLFSRKPAETLVVFLLGLLINIITLPYLGADLTHFLELIKVAQDFPWDGQILFFGKNYLAQNLPLSYLPTWILISTPVFILLIFGLSLLSFKKLISNKLYQLFFLSLFINLLIFFLVKPIIYDGLRHMLFLLPQMVVLGLTYLTPNPSPVKRRGVYLLILINIFLVFVFYLRFFPYFDLYFNESKYFLHSEQNFELDYWGASYREAVLSLNKQVDTEKKYLVYVCDDPIQAEYYFGQNLKLEIDKNKADYLLCNDRDFATPKGVTLFHEIKRGNLVINNIYRKVPN